MLSLVGVALAAVHVLAADPAAAGSLPGQALTCNTLLQTRVSTRTLALPPCAPLSQVLWKCGPKYGRCNLAQHGGRYCNEANGWCGNSHAHKNAQSSDAYDAQPAGCEAYEMSTTVAMTASTTVPASTTAPVAPVAPLPSCGPLSQVLWKCGPQYGRCNLAQHSGRYCNAASGWCGNSDAHKNAQSSDAYDAQPAGCQDGCGPVSQVLWACGEGIGRCNSATGSGKYCNEATKWCGDSDDHKNAGPGDTFDAQPASCESYGTSTTVAMIASTTVPASTAAPVSAPASCGPLSQVQWKCGPKYGRCNLEHGSGLYCNENTEWCGNADADRDTRPGDTYDAQPAACHAACGALSQERWKCGPNYGRCNLAHGSGKYCNELNGWCGNSEAHRNANSGDTFDAQPAGCQPAPEYVVVFQVAWNQKHCPSGTHYPANEMRCREAAAKLGKGFGSSGEYWSNAAPGCSLTCHGGVRWNNDAGVRKGSDDLVCESMEKVVGTTTTTTTTIRHDAVRKVDSICPNLLYTDKNRCSDGTAVAAGECCPGSNSCPSGCASGQKSFSNGKWSCSCQGCPKERKLNMSDEAAFVKAHDYLRCLHGHGELHWDATVAANAKIPATQSYNAGKLGHSQSYQMTPPAGENLAKGQASPEQAVIGWYNEIVDPGYTPGTWGKAIVKGVGHYTALIWKATTKVGCSSIGEGEQKVWACQYAFEPPNSGELDAWEQNVPQTTDLAATPSACCAEVYGS